MGTDYTGLGKLQYLVAQNGLTLIDTVYTEKVELLLMVPSEMQEQTEKKLSRQPMEKLIFPGVKWYYMQWLKENCKFFKIFSKTVDIFISLIYNSYC